MSLITGYISISAKHIVSQARRNNWDVALLRNALPQVSDAMLAKLLDGSAIVRDEYHNGAFSIYVPGHSTED